MGSRADCRADVRYRSSSTVNERDGAMKKLVMLTLTLVLLAGITVGCSSTPPLKARRGTLAPGTAQLSIQGKRVVTITAVRCSMVGSRIMIEVGGAQEGATVLLSNAGPLAVGFVTIRQPGGFTGDYNQGLEGDASVTLTGSTYDITGSALGYDPSSVEPTKQPFTIRVSC